MRPLVSNQPLFILAAACLLVGGCQAGGRPTPERLAQIAALSTEGLAGPQYSAPVQAMADPPAGWKPEPLKHDDEHDHQIWLSPSGRTAYGIIRFDLPWPVGIDLVFPAYLNAMKKSEGEALLHSKQKDPDLPGMRFDVEGGEYRTYGNMILKGFTGWVVYAGTLRKQPQNAAELEVAVRAREHTRVGVSSDPAAK